MSLGARYALMLIPVCFAATMVWGMWQFPDAPLRPCAQGYCGKYGALHTLAGYQCYVWWERISM